ncbi:MAG TPA: nuclear transport factor 2 family protein [Actinomycetota bacterium]
MAGDENQRIVERYWAALATGDFDDAAAFLSDDFVEDWPQSGERIIGPANWLEMARHHPTFPSIEPVRHEGQGDLWVSELLFDYGRGGESQPYHVCAVQHLREGRIASIVEYFAAPFEPADWRIDWVERT